MNGNPTYTPHHPRWYRPHISTYWWASRGSYFAFIMRELSSVFVAWGIVYLLLLVRAVRHDEATFQRFLVWGAHPVVVAVNIVALVFIVFHAITWFNLAPQAMVVKAAGRRVPGVVIAASNYGAWVVASAAIAWLLLGAR
jgi:fumarate reductase subunit C